MCAIVSPGAAVVQKGVFARGGRLSVIVIRTDLKPWNEGKGVDDEEGSQEGLPDNVSCLM